MRYRVSPFSILASIWLIIFGVKAALSSTSDDRVFCAHGTVEQIKPAENLIVIQHEAISNYMDAMTMPFKVRSHAELAGLQRGDQINFELNVGKDESWIAKIVKTGMVILPPLPANNPPVPLPDAKYTLLHEQFTNELGSAVSLSDFSGQALAITFFYTRCPLPDFCPRLSKNFEFASQKLEALTNAPANWHFLSISFDPEFDSARTLKLYGQLYHYDPAHWSFLTGPKAAILEIARRSGVTLQDNNGIINHNFRTLIIDASGHLQMVFPTSGDLSDQIVAEIIKAAAVTNKTLAKSETQTAAAIPVMPARHSRADSVR